MTITVRKIGTTGKFEVLRGSEIVGTGFFKRYVTRYQQDGFKGRYVSVSGHLIDHTTGAHHNIERTCDYWREVAAEAARLFA